MYETMADYLAEQREKRAAQAERARQAKLVELGLYSMEYLPEETETTTELLMEYPCRDEAGRRYKKVPLPVTEEEWAELCRYEPRARLAAARQTNPICRVLRLIAGIFYISGFVLGLLAAGYAATAGVNGLFQMLSTWFSAAVSGTAFLALSEIIRLLDK